MLKEELEEYEELTGTEEDLKAIIESSKEFRGRFQLR